MPNLPFKMVLCLVVPLLMPQEDAAAFENIHLVKNFPDIRIKLVDSFADESWRFRYDCTGIPDKRVEIVNDFEDLRVKITNAFPDRNVCVVTDDR